MLETVGCYGDAVIVVGLCSVPSRGPRKVRSGAVNANIPSQLSSQLLPCSPQRHDSSQEMCQPWSISGVCCCGLHCLSQKMQPA